MQHNRSLTILRIHGILLVLYTRVLTNHMTPPRSHKEGNTLALDQWSTKSVQRTMRQNVHKTSTPTTKLWQNVLPINQHISVQCGSCTLTRGRIHQLKTQTPPSHLLLYHLYPNRTEIQHLQMRILSGHKSFRKLETLSYMDENPIYHQNWPQEPYILEVPKETKWEDSPLAWMSTRLWLQNHTHH